jgi:hypothetical protein
MKSNIQKPVSSIQYCSESYCFTEKLSMSIKIKLASRSTAPYIVCNHQKYTPPCVFFFTIRKLPAIYIWIESFINRRFFWHEN